MVVVFCSLSNAQLFLQPQPIPHREHSLSQLQICFFSLSQYLTENTVSPTYKTVSQPKAVPFHTTYNLATRAATAIRM